MNEEKYQQLVPEAARLVAQTDVEPNSQPKVPQTEGKTLEEYYKQLGEDIKNTENKTLMPVKDRDLNADWVQKENATIMETKEDRRNGEKPVQQIKNKPNGGMQGLE